MRHFDRTNQLVLCLALAALRPSVAPAQLDSARASAALPRLHHVALNSVDPDRAIAWYLKLWPTATRTTYAGLPAVQAEMLLLFTKVDRPAPGGWRDDLHRGTPQSPFWHIGASINTTNIDEHLRAIGVAPLPLFVSPTDSTRAVWRSGLTPYAGILPASRIATAPSAPPRDGGFSYVLAPDGVIFELTGGPETKPSLSHIHFFHEQPVCAAAWYARTLGMEPPPTRGASGNPAPAAAPGEPCEQKYGEATWPALEPAGTIRSPAGSVRFANGSMAWYPRQCVDSRCGRDEPLVHSRGQVLDHVGFAVTDFDALYARLQREGVTILEPPHPFADTRAFMIEDPDGLAIELIDDVSRRSGPPPTR